MSPIRSMLDRAPISIRLAGLIALSFFALLCLIGVVVHRQLGAGVQSGIDRQLTNTGSRIADGSLGLASDDEPEEEDERGERKAEDDDDDEGLNPADSGVQVVSRSGRVLDSSGDLVAAPPLLDRDTIASVPEDQGILLTHTPSNGEEPLRIFAAPMDDQEAVAIVALELDTVRDAQDALLSVYIPIAILASLLAGLIGYGIARRGLAPIGRMTDEADEIESSNLSRRLSAPNRMDEVGHLARTLNGMLERLDAAIARERAFSADASHELRTPLAILRAEVELARQESKDVSTRAALQSALEEADRLAGLIDDLLVLARADADRVGGRRPIDLGELARAVMERFGTLAAKQGVRLDARGSAVVVGDARGIERALSNLLDNSLRHTPDGGRVQIEIEHREGGGRVIVEDTGPGVPEAELGRLFERFARIDGSRHQAGGAGLGLAIVAAVAAAHGGRVTARNGSEGGLVVSLDLGTIGSGYYDSASNATDLGGRS